MAFFDDLKDKATDLGRAGMAKSKQLMEITKLSLNSTMPSGEVRRSRATPPSASGAPPPRSTLRRTRPVSLRSRRTAPCPMRIFLRLPLRLPATTPRNKTTKALRPTGGGLFLCL